MARGSAPVEAGVELLPPHPLVGWMNGWQEQQARALAAGPAAIAAPPRGLGAGWYAWAVGGQLADAVTTQRFRDRGFAETNQRLRGLSAHPLELAALKVGIAVAATAGASVASVRLARRGHRGWARVVRLAPVAVGAWGFAAAIHNERLRR